MKSVTPLISVQQYERDHELYTGVSRHSCCHYTNQQNGGARHLIPAYNFQSVQSVIMQVTAWMKSACRLLPVAHSTYNWYCAAVLYTVQTILVLRSDSSLAPPPHYQLYKSLVPSTSRIPRTKDQNVPDPLVLYRCRVTKENIIIWPWLVWNSTPRP